MNEYNIVKLRRTYGEFVFGLTYLSYSDVILSGLVHVVNLDDDGKYGMGARRRFVHRRGANGTHFVPLLHETVDALLIADDCLSQVLDKTTGDEREKLCTEAERRAGLVE